MRHGARRGASPRARWREGVRDGHGLLERRGALGAREAGRAEQALQRRAALADQDRRARPSRRRRAASRSRSTPLSRPPAISTSGAGNARSAAMTASGWVPWESLTKRTPSIRATGSRRCSTPVNAAGRPADRVRGDAEEQARRRSPPARWRRCGGPGCASSSTGMIRPPGPACGHARRPASGRRSTAGRHDPAVHHAEAARHRGVVPVQDRRAPCRGRRTPPTTGILGVEHERAVRVHQLGEAALDPPVGLDASRGGRGGPR